MNEQCGTVIASQTNTGDWRFQSTQAYIPTVNSTDEHWHGHIWTPVKDLVSKCNTHQLYCTTIHFVSLIKFILPALPNCSIF